MLDRVFEHLEDAFISLFSGAWASIEVICRTSIESAINVLFVLEADTPERISQYVSYYFEQTSKTLTKAERIAPSDRTSGSFGSIDFARDRLKERKQHTEAVFRYEGIPVGVQGWPSNILDRFTLAGREQEYREIYATLSSQVHNDADALSDYVIVKTLEEHIEGAIEKFGMEMLFWLRYFIYRASLLYGDATRAYVTKYEVEEAVNGVERNIVRLSERLSGVESAFLSD